MTLEELKKTASLKNKKFRQEQGIFLIEGEHLLREALSSPCKPLIEKIFISKSLAENEKNSTEELLSFIKNSTHMKPEVLKDKEFQRISDTVNNPGIAATLKIVEKSNDLALNEDLIVYLEDINDPGNMGTILRNCYWYGVDKVLLSINSVDIYNPKVVRASQGALFFLNIITGVQDTILGDYLNNDYQIYLTSLDTSNYSDKMNFPDKKNIFVFGNESSGVSGNLLSIPESRKLKIRSYSDCESLNVAVASGIILHDYKRTLNN
ncbi:RNA methyltransferase [soil metagenome]